MAADLPSVLKAVRWAENVDIFCETSDTASRVERCMRRLAIWAQQIEIADKGNPALCFIHEARVQSHYVAALLGVALYKPAAGTMRALLDSALYYSFFRSHPVELGTLVRDANYFLQKHDIVEFHKQHTARFAELGPGKRLHDWYREASAIVHGQHPGAWVTHAQLKELRHDSATLEKALVMFERVTAIVESLFLVTIAPDLWSDFAIEVRKQLLREVSGDLKRALGLSIA